MSHTDSNTITPQHATRQPARFILPVLGANIAQAQHAGDFAYAMAEEGGYSLEHRAIEYHLAYTETMRNLGTPAPCGCDFCHRAAQPLKDTMTKKSKTKAETPATPAPDARVSGLTITKSFEMSFNVPERVVEEYNDALTEMLHEHMPEPWKAALWAATLTDNNGQILGMGDMQQITDGYTDLRGYLVRIGAIPVPSDYHVWRGGDPEDERVSRARATFHNLQYVLALVERALDTEQIGHLEMAEMEMERLGEWVDPRNYLQERRAKDVRGAFEPKPDKKAGK